DRQKLHHGFHHGQRRARLRVRHLPHLSRVHDLAADRLARVVFALGPVARCARHSPATGVSASAPGELVMDGKHGTDLRVRARFGQEPHEVWSDYVKAHPEFAGLQSQWLSARPAMTTPLDLGIPWVNYQALEWLSRIVNPRMRVFEWGSGGSTVFFA